MSDMGEPASHRWHRGFLRLYLVVAAFWLIGFGYTAYDANRRISHDRSFSAAYPGVNTREIMEELDEQLPRRTFALYALPLFPVGAPILYLIAMWILAGFRPRKKAQSDEPTGGRR
jgi:hypothetical protein